MPMNRWIETGILVAAMAVVAFGAGMSVGRAENQPWKAMILHIPSMKSADLPPKAPGKKFQVKVLAVADGGALQVQLGPVFKHYHENANEIQYIVSGKGKF